MNNKFDELTKNLARSVTRREALRRFGAGLAGVVLASLGLTNKARAERNKPGHGNGNKECNHCVYPYGCENLPSDQQAGCLYYCNFICG